MGSGAGAAPASPPGTCAAPPQRRRHACACPRARLLPLGCFLSRGCSCREKQALAEGWLDTLQRSQHGLSLGPGQRPGAPCAAHGSCGVALGSRGPPDARAPSLVWRTGEGRSAREGGSKSCGHEPGPWNLRRTLHTCVKLPNLGFLCELSAVLIPYTLKVRTQDGSVYRELSEMPGGRVSISRG